MSPIPAAWHCSTSAFCRSRPSTSDSANPVEITRTACTSLAAQSSITAGMCSAGTRITARSTGSGMSRTERYGAMPITASAVALTTCTRPVKSPPMRLVSSSRPMLARRALPPTMATDRASKMRRMELASARCSRAAITAWDTSVGSTGKA